MNGSVAIVTGAGRGIGRAVAVKLALEGNRVVINYKDNDAAAEESKRMCERLGAETLLLQGDVSDETTCRDIAEQAINAFGRVDILVNNAGICSDNYLLKMSGEDFDEVVRVNLKGTFNMMKTVSELMIRRKYGRIINIASVAGMIGSERQVNFAASKAGIIGLSKSFAREVSTRNITVNVVAPGYISTDMTNKLPEDVINQKIADIPLRKFGKPDDVANAVYFLAGRDSGYITGQVIAVDGGLGM